MSNTVLTDLAVRKLTAAPPKRFEVWDAKLPGFGIRVAPSGLKSFVLVYRCARRQRRLTIGRYPIVSLAEARALAMEALAKIARGVDPEPEKEEAPNNQHTFAEAVRAFVRLHCERYNKPVTKKDTERILNTRFVRVWGQRNLSDIKKSEILRILDGIVAEDHPSAANHALAAIRKFFNWCVERGLLEHSPCAGVRKPAKESSRDRVLSDAELTAIWNGADRLGYPYGAMVQLLLLTAQRRGEVAGMRWTHLDLEGMTWSLPAALTKNGRAHVVPLTSRAIEVLTSLPRLHDELVFPAARGAGTSVSDFSRAKRALDRLAGIEGWTLHDLRRTVATGMARLGVAPHVVERILNHVSGTFGGVAGVYNRFHYLPEMKAALDLWATHIATLRQRRGNVAHGAPWRAEADLTVPRV